MSNFSNSDHHIPHDSAQHNNAFFNDNSFGGIEGFLNNGATDAFDQQWAFNPDQFNVSGGSVGNWHDAGSQQQVPAHTFRPGAQPDQVFSTSLASVAGNASNLGYGTSNNAFAGFPQQHFGTSTISPSNLNTQPGQVQVRVPAPSSNLSSAGTIAPEALQSRPAPPGSHIGNAGSGPTRSVQTSNFAQKSRTPSFQLPGGTQQGKFSIINAEDIRQVANTGTLSAFLDVGNEALEFPFSKGVIPLYSARKSRNEIKRLLASDSKLSASLSKKPSKKSGLTGTKSIPARLEASGKLSTQVKKEQSSTSEEESTDDSEYESSDDEEPAKPPIPLARPTNPADATRYDTIKCLWRPKNSVVPPQSIRDGLKDFHEIISTIKDRWKSDGNAVKQAEESKKVNELPLLKERVKIQRDMLEVALKAAAEFGHPDIVDHFGTSLPGVGTLALFLQDRARDSDYNGGLVQGIMEFLSRCKMLDNGLLEKSVVGKLLPRFAKRGDDKVKVLAKRIENNAIAASKKKKEAPTKASSASSMAHKDAKAEGGAKSPPSAGGVKRARSTDSSSDPPAKKVVGKAGEAPGTKKPATPGVATKTPASAANKANPVVAKSSSFISSLQSAKRPPAAKPASGPAKAAPSKSSSDVKPSASKDQSFSFASVLADVSRPKEDKPKEQRPDDKRPPETAEEKAKRLRKEARRALRVRFKPEETLVEVRVFEHDPDEELGHDASQMRDVNDVGNEGKMFKMRQQHQIEDDDEELDAEAIEQAWRTWGTPKEVDFSDMPQEAQSENYRPYGGGQKDPECPEMKVQEEREASVLLTVYSQPSDIPPSPNEPGTDSDGMLITTKQFGELPSDHHTVQRIEEIKKIQPVAMSPHMPTPPQDISAILSMLAGGGAAPPPQPQAPGASQPSQDLAAILSQLPNTNQQQAPAPPTTVPQQQDMSAILNAMNQTSQQPQQNPQHNADISSILASLQQPSQQQQAAPPMTLPFMPVGMPPMGQFNAGDQNQNMWMAQAHQFASQGMPNMANMWNQSQPPGQPFENEQRKRFREQDDGDDSKRQNKFKKVNKDNINDPSKFFKVQCRYFQEGRCTKGANCTYRHDDNNNQ